MSNNDMTTQVASTKAASAQASAAKTPENLATQTPENKSHDDNKPLDAQQFAGADIDLEASNLEDDLNDADLKSADVEDSDAIDDDDDEVDNDIGQAVPVIIDMSYTVADNQAGLRIDKLAALAFTDFSRAQLQGWVSDGSLLCNGSIQKPKYRVKAGDVIHLSTTLQQHSSDQPENIPIEVIFEDDEVLVINKPVGMVVHPGAGNQTGTLVNALLYHYPQQHHLPRAGLVHRIDKDTSGLLLIGKTKPAQMALMAQLKDKAVYRHYQCVVAGDQASLKRHQTIDAPIGRHRNQRTKMTVMTAGREAVTHLLDITALNDNYCLLDVGLETGRTHQIRVHLSHITYPIVGDRVYGGRRQLRAGLTEAQRTAISSFPRQALHAYRLGFVHPTTGEDVEVMAPIPEDMQALIALLSDD
ncbi:RluA family pseudouridine synthase [Psychrobacter sp. T6-1]|uniref:RluA family pseudouridine synthase n=1 Tax=Psychrobacter sp. T6-1 TaxID=3457447 RepID=UPI003FD0AF73